MHPDPWTGGGVSRNEDFDNALWADPDISELDPLAKLLYIWSWTNPHCGMAGLYKIGPRRMSFDTGIDADEIPRILTALAECRLAFYEAEVMWVRARVRRIRSRSPQMARSIAKDVEKLRPEHPLRIRFLAEYASMPWLEEQLAILNDPADLQSPWVNPRVRAAVLDRDGHECVRCGATESLTMDHVTPRSHGGRATEDNLQTLCRSCNSKKGVSPSRAKKPDPMKGIEGMEPTEVPWTGDGAGGSGGVSGVVVRADVDGLCRRLADAVLARDPKARINPTSGGWRDSCRLLIDKDGRSVEQVEYVIDWLAAGDSRDAAFWQGNVLSMPKLRERFTQLVAVIQREHRKAPGTDRDADLDEWLNATGEAA